MSLFRSLATVSSFTLLSRVLGLFREIVVARFLGSSRVMDAFVTAFRLPNMFRRIFGEGAFNSAFVPLFGKELQEHGKEEAEIFASRTFSLLLLVLAVGTVLAMPLMPVIVRVMAPGYDEQTQEIAVTFGRIMFSYLTCMALYAQMAGVLNTIRIFGPPAFAPVLLNVITTTALLAIVPVAGWTNDPEKIGLVLTSSVMVAGLAQFLLVYLSARRHGFRIGLVNPFVGEGRLRIPPRIQRLFILMGPGVLAAGIQQINLIIGNAIASFQAGAQSWLNYADRINQLPLGIIGIALGVVLLPEISRRVKSGDEAGATATLNKGIEIALLITLPAALAMILVPLPIIGTLYEGGSFVRSDTIATGFALAGFALGLPAYVLVKVLQPAYFARENTVGPMLVAGVTVVINIVVSLTLFPFFGHIGIAIATSIAGWGNVALLLWGIRRHFRVSPSLLKKVPGMVIASFVMGATILGLQWLLASSFDAGFIQKALALGAIVATGGMVYFAGCFLTKVTSVAEMRRQFGRK